jgi:RNA polymerase-interacting CarD/CdnL/TRCF family regulator
MLIDVITPEEQKKQWRNAKKQYERWHKTGGVVFDVAALLENLSRVSGTGLGEKEANALQQVRRFATLVAAHALQSTALSEINNESAKYIGELYYLGDDSLASTCSR